MPLLLLKARSSCASRYQLLFLIYIVCSRLHVSEGVGFCPTAFELFDMRTPWGAGVGLCGTGEKPPVPVTTTLPITTTLTSTTVPMSTSAVWSLTQVASCCSTSSSATTAMPEYTTAPPYEYDWATTTTTRTNTSTTTVTQTTTSVTTTTTSTTTMSSTTMTNESNYTDPNMTTTNTTTSTSVTTSTTTNFDVTTTTRTDTTQTNTTTSTTITNTSTTVSTTTTTSATKTTTKTTTTRTTMTRTTRTATMTTATSTTTTTLTTLPKIVFPCGPLCSRLQPKACREGLAPDVVCKTTMLDSPCFHQHELTFACPGNNEVKNGLQMLVQGSYNVRCWVCGISKRKLIDVDTRQGFMLVDLKFGPNALGEAMNEDPISGYAVFLNDVKGDRLFVAPVLSIAKKSTPPLACCEDDVYEVRVIIQLPPKIEKIRLEIAPVLKGLGPLSVGRLTDEIEDAMPFVRTISSDARRHSQGIVYSFYVVVVIAALEFALVSC
eukprot:TRINITY_DN3545_c0_g1_i1.p1 TRINITY_DN3545_c0_g1~~TRINITY_DN3545_c0_g1_i1.p1  ORF type:complete len:492 (-),score=39.96 TRINITY_DN3545_c0_g1_i1:213-1688(-)